VTHGERLESIRRSAEQLVAALDRQNPSHLQSLNVRAATAELRALLVRAAETDR
jgi:hypothetical protein